MSDIQCFLVEPTGEWTPWQDHSRSEIWRRVDTSETFTAFPVGAMYYASADSQKYYRPGPDGRTLFVVTPGGTWCPDERASNCTLPNDNEHYCWVRHGVPPMVTVDKVGKTCEAGAGSILMGKYHGFLRNGKLTNC